jgi:hypothetical protein
LLLQERDIHSITQKYVELLPIAKIGEDTIVSDGDEGQGLKQVVSRMVD